MDPRPPIVINPAALTNPHAPPIATPEREAWALLSQLIDAWEDAMCVVRTDEHHAARERFQQLHTRARGLIAWAIRNGESS